MNLVIKTTFLAIMAVAISQPVQAGKFKDFFTSKTDKEVTAKKIEPKKQITKPALVKASVAPSLGRVPRLVLASTWVPEEGARKAAIINSERELDTVTLKQTNIREKSAKQAKVVRVKRLKEEKHAGIEKAARVDKVRAKAEIKARKVKTATVNNDNKPKKGNWFTRTFKSDKDSKK